MARARVRFAGGSARHLMFSRIERPRGTIQRLLQASRAALLASSTASGAAAAPEAAPGPASGEVAPAESGSAPAEGGPLPPRGEPRPSVIPPRPLGELSAEYPAGASGDHAAVVELTVGTDGVPRDVRVLDPVSPFAEAALEAAERFRFSPAERNGKPIAAKIRLEVRFVDPGVSPEAAAPGGPEGAAPNSAAPPPGAAPAPIAPPQRVTVSGRRSASVQRLTRAEVRELPGAFGDAFRAIESLPGVTPIASGLPYFFVRGAPPGNTGYFIDGLSIPSLYHAAVGPSVIHPAFIESVELYSGAYPARYGRFAGAIVAGTSAQPTHRLRGEASVRLVDSGAFVEIPIGERRGSVMLAGRYSYTGLLVSLLVPEVEIGYWDYQARAQYRLNEYDTLTLFGFGAHDFLSALDDGVQETVYDVTFHRLDATFRRSLSEQSAIMTGLSLGWDQTGSGSNDSVALESRRIGTRLLYTSAWSRDVQFRTGMDLELSRFSIGLVENFGDDDDDDDGPDGGGPGGGPDLADSLEDSLEELPFAGLPIPRFEGRPLDRQAFTDLFASRNDLLGGAWCDWQLDLGHGVSLTPGFRFDFYRSKGSVKLAPEPRLSARFRVAPNFSLLHDIGIAHQAPSFAIPVPGFSGTASAGLQRGVQTSAGAEWQITDATRAQLTFFQTALFAGSDPIGLFQLDNADLSVDGATARVTAHTYGAEIYLKRDLTERLGGFISYTLSRSTRATDRLFGPSSVDRTHVLNVAAAYRLGDSWRLGGRAVYYSGVPAEVAYPRAASSPPRGPAFYRFDWRVEKRWSLGETGFWALVAEMQNSFLRSEQLDTSCYAYGCEGETIGPVTVPSLGVEASF